MPHPTGEVRQVALGLAFDRRIKLEFHGSKVTSDAGLLAYRELDTALGLSETAADLLADTRTSSTPWPTTFFLRTLALPDEVERWSLSTLREKVVKIGAKVLAHARSTIFQMAEVAVPRKLFGRILEMIGALRPRPIARC